MLEAGISSHNQSVSRNSRPAPHYHLSMQPARRMGGTMPVWAKAENPLARIETRLATADAFGGRPERPSPANALSYTAPVAGRYDKPSFSFGDMVDMVNPLHHIPLVGSVYRALTGDDISPASKIVGGGLYGGPSGAAAGIVNLIAEHETGRDIPGHIIAMAAGDDNNGPARQTEQVRRQPREDITRLALSSYKPAHSRGYNQD